MNTTFILKVSENNKNKGEATSNTVFKGGGNVYIF